MQVLYPNVPVRFVVAKETHMILQVPPVLASLTRRSRDESFFGILLGFGLGLSLLEPANLCLASSK